MHLTLVLVVGIVSVVATSAVADRIGVAAPLGLVLVGIAMSFVPGVHVELEPEIVLDGVLPPLLYASATRMPGHDFRRNFGTIFALAVYLVALTTVGAGYLAYAVLPGVGLAACLALGAVVSPTDAVAATSVGSKLGLPSRLTAIIEGEGLVNDATALVLLTSAATAISTPTHVWRVGVDFVYSVAVATAFGLVVGLLGVVARAWLRDAVTTTAVSFTIPFVAFLPADLLDASGVLAVVVAGLVSGAMGPRHLPAPSRLAESVNWRTIAFLLEGGIFLVLGLQLKPLWNGVEDAGLSAGTTVATGLLVAALTLGIRIVFVAPVIARLRYSAERAGRQRARIAGVEQKIDDLGDRLTPRRLQQARQRVAQHKADLDFSVTQRLGARGGGVLAWSGMRGAVTVAAAQTLPADTPHRAQLILIAFTVAVVTLLVQGASLPYVIRWLEVPGDDPALERVAYAALAADMTDAAAEAVSRDAVVASVGVEAVERMERLLRDRAKPREQDAAHDEQARRHGELMGVVLAAQREALLAAQAEGRYSSAVLHRAQQTLDLQELMVQRLPSTSG
ncbi:sodium/proton antiporter, CPA1 family [Jatrophihabitans endophyticus]|uniref:Sodium/proton antiporter, CPA1 family n=1 Tax=Jatrophihabitans endophyticus TaxID=1206085 RepID=A0A1M5HSH6_9ACTN|nr:cation:proton antiporter [Jatrophihabitans endophyticus]SHG18802.1 sodium/proton antiporter, CPA1 family [Jatrophihabitans endophyticus]